MVNAGCVARVLSNFHSGTMQWVKAVNPGWYEKREIPKTMLKENKRSFQSANVKVPLTNQLKDNNNGKSKVVHKIRYGKRLYPLRKLFK